jgi:hypothetical protein
VAHGAEGRGVRGLRAVRLYQQLQSCSQGAVLSVVWWWLCFVVSWTCRGQCDAINNCNLAPQVRYLSVFCSGYDSYSVILRP